MSLKGPCWWMKLVQLTRHEQLCCTFWSGPWPVVPLLSQTTHKHTLDTYSPKADRSLFLYSLAYGTYHQVWGTMRLCNLAVNSHTLMQWNKCARIPLTSACLKLRLRHTYIPELFISMASISATPTTHAFHVYTRNLVLPGLIKGLQCSLII